MVLIAYPCMLDTSKRSFIVDIRLRYIIMIISCVVCVYSMHDKVFKELENTEIQNDFGRSSSAAPKVLLPTRARIAEYV